MSNDNQRAFDVVYRHLMTQKTPSKSPRGCWYRHPDNLKCAIGALISDSAYSDRLEGWRVSEPPVRKAVIDSGYDCDVELLRACQIVHDVVSVNEWDRELRRVAARFGLTVPAEVPS